MSVPRAAEPSAEQLLGPAGPLRTHLAGYEVRAGQLDMARAVEHTLAHAGVLLCEAGTGTGKTLAYLVPAVQSGKKVVVSTATRALQEQIFEKDLPLLQRALGLDPRAAIMKGLGNYVCRRRLAEFQRSPEANRHADALAAIERWLARTEVGDTAEVTALSEHDPIWPEVVASSDTRVGPSCAHFADCFVARMRRAAESARLLVVNHHLFFADLALRGPHPGRVIPAYDAVVFDEAHQLEDTATSFFGVQVSASRVERLARDGERALAAASAFGGPVIDGAAGRLVPQLRLAADQFWSRLRATVPADDGRVTLERDVWTGPLQQDWHALDAICEALAGLARSARESLEDRPTAGRGGGSRGAVKDALEVVERRLEQLRGQLSEIVEAASGTVTWLDRSARGTVLGASPVDLSETFRSRIFDEVSAVVLTSATLASDSTRSQAEPSRTSNGPRPFAYVRSRLGLDEPAPAVEAVELVVQSPFDFEARTMLYTPRDLPPPAASEFIAAATDRAVELIEMAGGGAFVLTTSLRSMRALASGLRRRLQRSTVLVQGEAPKSTLLDQFRAVEDSVLVATMSFWEGVDIPGQSLRLVILEKIPFPVPIEPIVRARSLRLEEAGHNPFLELFVPAAAITLKQGFGRLIRTREDFGVVALFDARVHRRGYGQRLLAALPPARRTTDLQRVRAFWQERAAARVG